MEFYLLTFLKSVILIVHLYSNLSNSGSKLLTFNLETFLFYYTPCPFRFSIDRS